MLTFEVFKIKISISFSFFAVIGLICMWENAMSKCVLIMLLCCTLHELGHVFFMFLFSLPPEEIVFYGGGIKICKENNRLISSYQNLLILSAGCAVNIILACISVLIERKLNYFACANLFFGLFNLMPVKYFDGGRILSEVLNDSDAAKIIRILFIAAFAAVIAVMTVNGLFSISLIVTFIYILLSEFLI